MSIADLFTQAGTHHRAGNLDAAETLYRQILSTQPDHADSLHLLGVITHQRGDNPAAIDLIRRAIALSGTDPAYRSNLAVALSALGRLEEAVGQLQEAVRLDPRYALARKNLGLMLNRLGRPAEALPHLRRAIDLAPQDAGALRGFGVALLSLGRRAEAVDAFTKALALNPDDAETLNNLGVALKDLGRLDEGVTCLRKAVRARPDFVDAYNNLGTALYAQRALPEAEAALRDALRLRPDHPDAMHNLGVVLRDLGRLDEGVACIRQALQATPGDPEMLNNLGVALQAQADYDGAMAHYEYALRAMPDHVWARFNRATLLLSAGDYPHGWLEYEWRWKRPGLAVRRFDRPLWDGSPAPGRTLLLYGEQGLGDTLQFVRYAALARERVGAVVVECQDLLLPILSRCRGIERFVAKGADLPRHDLHAPLMSLPGILGTTVDTVPADVPYVFPDPALVRQWQERLKACEGYRVGINWQGNPQFQRDTQRSMPLAHFAPLARVPGVRLISLQWGYGREQLSDGSADFPVTDFGEDLDREAGAFMDRAAIMAGLDLVITSDTATPHLAGAMGVPVWVALSASPDWRWHRAGERCPWYPSMRLFRQPRPGDWPSVFHAMARSLHEVAAGKRRP